MTRSAIGRWGRLEVSPLALLLPAALILLDAIPVLIMMIFAAAVHELGHVLGLKLFRGRLISFRLGLLGCSIAYDDSMSYSGEIATALLGPLASLMLAVAAALCGKLTGVGFAYQFSGVSLALGIFNLLPVYPLDGGRAIYFALAYVFGLDLSARIIFVLRCIVVSIVAYLGYVAVLSQPHNPVLLICAIILIFMK